MSKIAQLLHSGEFWWIAFGFGAQALFFMRFLVQWIASERSRRSVMPKAFWYFSLAGGLMLLTYAIHRRDPVFIVGQGTGVLIYLRNITFIHGKSGWDISFVVLLVILSGMLFGVGVADSTLWASGEGYAAEIAREMYVSGDYIVPRYAGADALTKPPLYHWAAAASYAVFGVNEFAARLPSVLAGMATVLLTFAMGRRIFDSRLGLLAALMVTLSIDFVWNARAARVDMLNTCLTVAAMTAWLYAASSRRRKRGGYLTAFMLMGLAFMAKGPVGVLLPLVGGIGYLYAARMRFEVRRIPWMWGAAVFLVIVLPWYSAAALRVSPEGRSWFLYRQLGHWLLGDTKSVGGFFKSLFMYVPYLLKGFFPWSLFLPGAVYVTWTAVRKNGPASMALPLVWFVVGFAAFSLSGAKASRYMLPMFPPAAIMTAFLWVRATAAASTGDKTPAAAAALSWVKWSALAAAIMTIAAGAVFWALPAMRNLENLAARLLNGVDRHMLTAWGDALAGNAWTVVVPAAAAAVASCIAVVTAWRGRTILSFAALATVMTGFLVNFNLFTLPQLDRANGVRLFVTRLEEIADGGPVGWTWVSVPEAPFYLGRGIQHVPPKSVPQYIRDNPDAVVLVPLARLDAINPADLARLKTIMVSHVKHRTVVALASPENPNPAVTPAAGVEAPQR